jgi:hypothetical protein
MSTRVTHTIRCRSKTNPTLYVDITILDAISVVCPDGTTIVLAVTSNIDQVNKVPCVIDKTGDKNAVGTPTNCSRVSHMEQFISQIDPTQIVDLEVLDVIALRIPTIGDPTDTSVDNKNLGGFLDSGQFFGTSEIFVMPSANSNAYIVDNTGLGLQQLVSNATRGCHINLVTDKGNTDDQTAQTTVIPPTGSFVATVRTDAVAYGTTDGNTILLLAPLSHASETDATKYVTDPYTGEPNSPPDHDPVKDPNVFAFFPESSSGANLGKAPVSQQTGIAAPPNLGMFWWIKKIAAAPQPYFWYAPPQQYLAFSAFFEGGASPCCAQYGYRGFQLLNDFPVDYGLGANYPLQPMGSFGSPTLDLCCRSGNFAGGSGFYAISSGGVGFAPNPTGGTVTYGPFDVIPMTDPPLVKGPNSDPLYGSITFPFLPNIWQLTGLTQPNLTHPSLPWDAIHNPYLYPTASLAERAANAMMNNWNSVANACNAIELSWVPEGGPGNGITGGLGLGNPPAGWNWAISYPADGIHLKDPIPTGLPFWGTVLAFQNAIPPTLGRNFSPPGAVTLQVLVPVNIFTMALGSSNISSKGTPGYLDPKVWDTTKCVTPAGYASPPPRLIGAPPGP